MTGGAPNGDAALSNHDTNRSSGGAGGNAGGLGGGGGAGGAGGGTIELSADGDITINDLEAKGGNGANGSNDGGGGSGGTILLRTGGTAMVSGTIVIAGGTGDGAGSIGRFRLDAPAVTVTVDSPQAPPYRGPQFAINTPLVTGAKRPMITVFGGALKPFQYYFSNEDGTMLRGPVSTAIGVGGQNTFPLAEDLFVGGNTLCLLVEGAELGLQKPEARNCITLIYAP